MSRSVSRLLVESLRSIGFKSPLRREPINSWVVVCYYEVTGKLFVEATMDLAEWCVRHGTEPPVVQVRASERSAALTILMAAIRETGRDAAILFAAHPEWDVFFCDP